MDATTLKKLSIEEKLKLYHALADDIIEHLHKEDGIHNHCFRVRYAPIEQLEANNYNPNRMPRREMDLLRECITKFGFLFPIIARRDEQRSKWVIIDGFHRYEEHRRAGRKFVAFIELSITHADAVQLTVLMNRIKGMHQVERMSDLVLRLEELGLTDSEIADNLGMEAEELMRLKQQLGIAHAFKNVEYANSWVIQKK